MSLRIQPITFARAKEYVADHHRHHRPPQGHKFSICVVNEENVIVGVCMAGRPVNRTRDDGFTLEVTRLCTIGVKNSCSILYGAVSRIAKEMGYRKIGTYILESESGVSLKASGWKFKHAVKGHSWDRPDRPRSDDHPLCDKQYWEKVL